MLLILDCDGVLVDSEPLSAAALSEALTTFGLPMTADECRGAFVGRSWMSVEEMLRERFGPLPAGLERDYRERMTAAFERELRPMEGVVSALDELSDVPMCVASSGPHAKMRHSLALCGLWERFDGRIFSAWDVLNGKPAPDLFFHAASSMGFDAQECVVVEDSPVGVEAARAAGMRVLGYAAQTPAAALLAADVVFDDFALLPELLSALDSVPR